MLFLYSPKLFGDLGVFLNIIKFILFYYILQKNILFYFGLFRSVPFRPVPSRSVLVLCVYDIN